MLLHSINISGFGCLRTSVNFAPDRLNLIIADNEQGKSTLVAALLASFFGIVNDARKKNDKRPNSQVFSPWNSPEQFGVELKFTQNDISYTLNRNFASGSVRLIDEGTGREISDVYHRGKGRYDIGRKMLGLGFRDFVRSFYLQQEEFFKFLDEGDLTSHIQRIATSSDDRTTSENAIENLRTALRKYPYSDDKRYTIENALRKFTDERNRLENRIAVLKGEKSEIEPLLLRLSEINRDYAQLSRDQELNRVSGDWAERGELRELVSEQELLAAQHGELSEEIEVLSEYKEFPADRSDLFISSSATIKQLSLDRESLHEKLRTEVTEPLEELDKIAEQDEQPITVSDEELKEFEGICTKLTDRSERLSGCRNEYDKALSKQVALGYRADKHADLDRFFGGFDSDNLEFTAGYSESASQLNERLNDLNGRYEQLRDERQRNERQDKKVTSIALVTIFFAVISVTAGIFIALLFGQDIVGYVLVGTGVVLSLFGWAAKKMLKGSSESEGNSVQDQYDDCRMKRQTAEREVSQLTERVNQLCQQSGHSDIPQMIAGYEEYARLSKLKQPLQSIELKLHDAERAFDEIARETHYYFETSGWDVPDNDQLVPRSSELLQKFRTASTRNAQIEALQKAEADIMKSIESKQKEIDAQETVCADILREAGIEDITDLDDAVNRFRERLESHKRYHKLLERLDMIGTKLLTEAEITAKRERLRSLEDALPHDSSPPKIEHGKEHYRKILSEATEQKEQLSANKVEIHRQIAAKYERYQSEMPRLKENLSSVEESIEKAERFRNEIQLAMDKMENISQSVYRSWARALSDSAKPLLQALNPKYDNIVFNEDLSFTVHDSAADQDIKSKDIQQVLSGGARDEIFLAARLGVASYLSRDAKDTLPIVLDEPFASVDDDKFLSGMEFLLDKLSRKHQLLLLSCHEERHNYLERKLPGLYRDRVNLIHLNRDREVIG